MATNPILTELSQLSPGAQQALLQAHQASTNAPPQQAPQTQNAEPPPSLQAPKMSSPVPQLGMPPSPNVTEAGRGTLAGDQAERSRLLSTGSGISQIHSKIENSGFGQAHPVLGKLLGWGAEIPARAAEIGGAMLGPTAIAEGLTPGTQYHHMGELRNLNNLIGQESQEGATAANTAKTQTQTAGLPQEQADAHEEVGTREALQKAQTDNAKAETAEKNDAAQNPSLIVGHAHAVDKAIREGRDPSQDPIVQAYENRIIGLQPKQNAPAEAPKTIQVEKNGKPHQMAWNPVTGKYDLDQGESGEKPPAVNVNEGTWSVQTDKQGNPVLLNSKTGETKAAPSNLARKPNAEEEKRADLAQNVNENLDRLEDILTRRPDLFGPVAGRLTGLKELTGTGDPDVAALKTIEDALGMAMQSAHGMRSAQHVATSAQSVLNGFHNSPKAMKAAIDAARGSIGTFQSDIQDTNQAGKPSQNGQPPRPANVPDGYHFDAHGPKGAGWYK